MDCSFKDYNIKTLSKYIVIAFLCSFLSFSDLLCSLGIEPATPALFVQSADEYFPQRNVFAVWIKPNNTEKQLQRTCHLKVNSVSWCITFSAPVQHARARALVSLF